MALGKGAYAIHQSGKWYTNENIDQMLMERYLYKKARRGSRKNHLKGLKKRTEEDDKRFAQSFEKLVLVAQTQEGDSSMAKSKKTKIHKKIDGQLLQMNKSFNNLKLKQKEKITSWVYEEYKKYATENEKVPDSEADEHIIEAVLDKINEAQIWIPSGEIVSYYHRKKLYLQKRLDNEKNIKFKSYVNFYKSIVDQDRCAVVICNLDHEIIYMNPAAVFNYEKWGGEKLIGRSLMECHNQASGEKIQQVVDWFTADDNHNIVYTFHNEKQNKDVYMVALREEGKLIGYYEKHEYRNTEKMKLYDLW